MIERDIRRIVEAGYHKLRRAGLPAATAWVSALGFVDEQRAMDFMESCLDRIGFVDGLPWDRSVKLFCPGDPCALFVFGDAGAYDAAAVYLDSRGLAAWMAHKRGGWVIGVGAATEENRGIIRYIWPVLRQFYYHANHPCGYIVKSNKPTGFGMSPSDRRATAGTVFYTLVQFNRLYLEAARGGVHIQREPHPRGAHNRHLWKRAGIDRLTLPRDARARQALAQERRVRIVRVSETWVGPSRFETDGYRHEIMRNVEIGGEHGGQAYDGAEADD